jgi:hypothetical protein
MRAAALARLRSGGITFRGTLRDVFELGSLETSKGILWAGVQRSRRTTPALA